MRSPLKIECARSHAALRSSAVANRAMLLLALCCLAPGLCRGQTRDVACSNGDGKFEAKFTTGVNVFVGPETNGELARRVCTATLSWDQQNLVVTPEASQVDVDALGVDLGLGVPVVAFQVKKSDVPSRMAYEIYSLQNPPRLLREITGGDYFSAADSDLDGRVEIWTGDVGVADGFEGLALGEFDFAPTLVLRFEDGRLMDVSSEFQSRFDQQIAMVRAQLGPDELANFKNSDGRLLASSSPAAQRDQLRATKVKVLEIVWAYLYSGREPQAWSALASMWPPADIERIRASVLDARAHGIRAQVDPSSLEASHVPSKKHAYVFETPNYAEQKLVGPAFTRSSDPNPDSQASYEKPDTFPLTDTTPQPILLRIPPPAAGQQALPRSEAQLDLLIDAAGKVRSAKPIGKIKVDDDVIRASAAWKFIPAYKDGHAVACHLHFAVSPDR
jgi:hypothetical protein